jgi:hypothetical protein
MEDNMRTHRSIRIVERLLIAGILLCGLSAFVFERMHGATPDEYSLTGPYTHKNLSVFLIHGKSADYARKIMTLQDAMEKKLVVVYETGSVNELQLENVSIDIDVFIQAGDIVKGGKQDRVLGVDMILSPKSGKITISAFCVEHGRWTQRGHEDTKSFSGSGERIATKDAMLAFQHKKDQAEVWRSVEKAQENLSRSVGASVQADQSASSFQLTLENKAVRESVDEYVRKLSDIAGDEKDAIGYVSTVNGKVIAADVYASHELFLKLWPKLLKAAAVEALAQYDEHDKIVPMSKDKVKTWLNTAVTAKGETSLKAVNTRTRVETRESDESVYFETRDTRNANKWIHRNYLKK